MYSNCKLISVCSTGGPATDLKAVNLGTNFDEESGESIKSGMINFTLFELISLNGHFCANWLTGLWDDTNTIPPVSPLLHELSQLIQRSSEDSLPVAKAYCHSRNSAGSPLPCCIVGRHDRATPALYSTRRALLSTAPFLQKARC